MRFYAYNISMVFIFRWFCGGFVRYPTLNLWPITMFCRSKFRCRKEPKLEVHEMSLNQRKRAEQEAQLSQRGRATFRVMENLSVTHDHS